LSDFAILISSLDDALAFYLQNQAKKQCHSRMFLAGIQKNKWIPDIPLRGIPE